VRDLSDTHEHRAGQRNAEPIADDAMESAQRQWPQGEKLQMNVRKATLEAERQLLVGIDSSRREQSCPAWESAQGKPKRSLGRWIDPLHIVDGEEHRRDHAPTQTAS
jgi:hypothetical protein